jgi:hypothetical protein
MMTSQYLFECVFFQCAFVIVFFFFFRVHSEVVAADGYPWNARKPARLTEMERSRLRR